MYYKGKIPVLFYLRNIVLWKDKNQLRVHNFSLKEKEKD